jgi:hypothetical protein
MADAEERSRESAQAASAGPHGHAALVLDTSLFVNPDTQALFGADMKSAVEQFLQIGRARGLALYMPQSIYRELSHFAEQEVLDRVQASAVVRGPDMYNLQIPAALVHLFIGELRQRVNKGLRIAESAIRSENTEANVKRIRQQYREALRTGIVDSVEDFDVVLLAKEVGGAILSADDGIAQMAETLGLEVFSAKGFLIRYGDGRTDRDQETEQPQQHGTEHEGTKQPGPGADGSRSERSATEGEHPTG